MVAVRLLTAVVAAALLALPVVTACGDEDEGAATAPPAATATVPTGPAPPGASDGAAGIMLAGSGLSVAEIPGAPADEILAVRAYVVVAPDGSAQLCDALAESHPPQCGGASMPLTGLPDGFLTGLGPRRACTGRTRPSSSSAACATASSRTTWTRSWRAEPPGGSIRAVPGLHAHMFGPENGPPLLLLHGVTGTGTRFRRFAEEELPGVRVIAPDLRGHGDSTWDPPWHVDGTSPTCWR